MAEIDVQSQTYERNGRRYDVKTGQEVGSPTNPTDAQLAARNSTTGYDVAGNKVQVGDPSINPQFRYTETPAVNGTTASRYGGAVAGAASDIFSAGGAYDSTVKPYTQDDLATIRDQERQKVQARIDSIKELQAIELADAAVRAKSRLGQTRSIASSTGVLGSPTGNTQLEKTSQYNAAEAEAIRAEANAKIQDILAGVEDRVNTVEENRKLAAQTNADKYVSYLKDVSTQARNDIVALAQAGAELTPTQMSTLADQAGYDPATFDTLYNSLKVANSDTIINKDKPEIVGNKAVFFQQGTDANGQPTIKTITLDLPESTAGKEIKSTVSRDDGIYVLYNDGSYDKIGGPSASYIKATSEDTSTGGDVTTQFTAARNALNNAKKLADAAGRGNSWIEQQKQGLFGATEYTNLVAYANTLRTSVLALATDPAVKKFFGPQMSNADVALMTSAGTSLNPELQGPDEFKQELDSLEALFTRLAAAKGVDFSDGDDYSKAEAAAVGDTVTIDGVQYKKTGADEYEPL